MKVSSSKSNNVFKPVSLTITFESQEELDAIYSLFNYSPVCAAMVRRGVDCWGIRGVARSIGGKDVHNWSEFQSELKAK